MKVKLEGLEDTFDNDQAESILALSLGRITYTSDLLRKSMYDFDLEAAEGIEKLMTLLPIMDPEILKDIMTEIWPGYPTELDARRHRAEIKGVLRDYLETNEKENDLGSSGSADVGSSEEEGQVEQVETSDHDRAE